MLNKLRYVELNYGFPCVRLSPKKPLCGYLPYKRWSYIAHNLGNKKDKELYLVGSLRHILIHKYKDNRSYSEFCNRWKNNYSGSISWRNKGE